MPTGSREAATRVLYRVDEDQAWASPVLDAEIRRLKLSERDAALATSIVYGALRVLPDLDRAWKRWAKHDRKVDPWVRAVFRSSVYQLHHLSRVPPRAVVHDAVALVRKERGDKMSGFANAVLRRAAESRPDDPKPPTRLVVPSSLEGALVESLGAERSEALLALDTASPTVDLRLNDPNRRDELSTRIKQQRSDAVVQSGKLSPFCLRLRHCGDPRRLPGYDRGEFAVQEEGSQLVGLCVGAQPGERVLDACAGHGGKTGQLLLAVGAAGAVTATDIRPTQLAEIPAEMQRLGLEGGLACIELDLAQGVGEFRAEFDRVLVDAPCTGLGTLQRRPEILLRTRPEDLPRMGETQRLIMTNAARLLKPGGLLTYAVCSPMIAEALPGVTVTDLEPLSETAWPGIAARPDDDGWLRIGPWTPGADRSTDVYQVRRWRKSPGNR